MARSEPLQNGKNFEEIDLCDNDDDVESVSIQDVNDEEENEDCAISNDPSPIVTPLNGNSNNDNPVSDEQIVVLDDDDEHDTSNQSSTYCCNSDEDCDESFIEGSVQDDSVVSISDSINTSSPLETSSFRTSPNEVLRLERKRKSSIDDISATVDDDILANDSTSPSSKQRKRCLLEPSGGGSRTRSVIPTNVNFPTQLSAWKQQYRAWSNEERNMAINELIADSEPMQIRHMMKVIEPQFQRDFISLLPKELALCVLSYLEPKYLLRAAQTCRSWRFLAEDNLLWREKCREAGIALPSKRLLAKNPISTSQWKVAYMRRHSIEMNWRTKPIRSPKRLKGHDDHVITCLQFCGNKIVSGSDDNTLKIWSATTGKCLRTLVGHTGGVWSSQMSETRIISGSTDRTLKVWDADTGVCIHTLYGHTSTVRCMHLHGNKVVSGSRDATLRVWDVEQGQSLHVLVGHMAAVRCVQYNGELVVSGAYDYMVKVWNPETEECLHTLSGHTNRVYSLQFDGVHVVSGSLDTSIRVWDVRTGVCIHTLMGHQSLTSGMELRNHILVSGNADSTVKVWDILTGHCLQTLSGQHKHQSAVTCLQFNNYFVVTSSDDGTVKLWDVKTGAFIRNLVTLGSGGSGGVVWRIRASETKLVCAVGSRNGTEETKLLVLDFDIDNLPQTSSTSKNASGSELSGVQQLNNTQNTASCSGNSNNNSDNSSPINLGRIN